jgi:hypothetical protein
VELLNNHLELHKADITPPAAPPAADGSWGSVESWQQTIQAITTFANQLQRIESVIVNLATNFQQPAGPRVANTREPQSGTGGASVSTTPRPQPTPPPPPQPPPPPIKIYSAILGLLTSIPADMQAKDMHQWLTLNRDQALPLLEQYMMDNVESEE